MVTSLGIGAEPFWQNIVAGKPGVHRIQSFGASAFTMKIASEVTDFDPESFMELKDRAVYCIEFHPHYRDNGQIFVCSRTHPEGGAGINYLSRFIISRRDKQPLPGQIDRHVIDPATDIAKWDFRF